MRVVSLMNFDHMDLVASSSNRVTTSFVEDDDGTVGLNLFTLSGNTGIELRNERKWLAGYGFGAMLGFPQFLTVSANFPTAKRVYYGARVFTHTTQPTGMLVFSTYQPYTGLFLANANTEYFVEAVYDLVNKTVTLYVGDTVIPVTGAATSLGGIGVGSSGYQPDSDRLLKAGSDKLLFNDYYCVAVDKSESSVPDRIGPCRVKSAEIASVNGAGGFLPTIGSDTVISLLNRTQPDLINSTTYPMIKSDPYGDKMTLTCTGLIEPGVLGGNVYVWGSKSIASKGVVELGVGGKTIIVDLFPAFGNTFSAYGAPMAIPVSAADWGTSMMNGLTFTVSGKVKA